MAGASVTGLGSLGMTPAEWAMKDICGLRSGNARSGSHDDLVLAVAISLFLAIEPAGARERST
jgi:hypothetical protein